MMTVAEKSNNSAKWFCGIPISIEEYLSIKDTITKECRWYLMGRISEREKLNRRHGETVEQLLARYGQKLGYTESSLRRFVQYSIALDYLQVVEPTIAVEVISGKLRMSSENLIHLANKPRAEIPLIVKRIKSGDEKLYEIFSEVSAKYKKSLQDKQKKDNIGVSVKDVPQYDPDTQVMGLAYTIPSWVSAINRLIISDNFNAVSKTALKKLKKELSLLKESAELMMKHLAEEDPGKERV